MLSDLTGRAAPVCNRRRPTLHNGPLNISNAPPRWRPGVTRLDHVAAFPSTGDSSHQRVQWASSLAPPRFRAIDPHGRSAAFRRARRDPDSPRFGRRVIRTLARARRHARLNSRSSVAFSTRHVLAYCLHSSAGLGSRLRRAKRNRKHVRLAHLVEVFQKISEQSIVSRSERSLSWDFERSSKYVRQQGLQDHIAFVSARGRDRALPLNSERHIYDIDNIVVRDLEIELDDGSAWDAVEDWTPVSDAKLHFEGCRFQCPSPNM